MRIISKNSETAYSSSIAITKNGIIKAKNQFMKQLDLVKKVKATKDILVPAKLYALDKEVKIGISKAKNHFIKEVELVQKEKTAINSTSKTEKRKNLDSKLITSLPKPSQCQKPIPIDTAQPLEKQKGRKVTISNVKERCTCGGPECNKLTDEMRERINQNFRNLSKIEKQNFVWQNVDVQKVGKGTPGRYSQEYRNTYHLKIDGLDFTVCRRMFVRTTGVCEWTIRNWLKQNRLLEKVPLPEVIVKEEMTQDVRVLMKMLQKFLEEKNPFKNISPEVKRDHQNVREE